MTTIEIPVKQTPSPADMLNVKRTLTNAAFKNAVVINRNETYAEPKLTAEEYRNQADESEPNPSTFIEAAQADKATLGYSPEDDKNDAEYTSGFTLHEDNETNSDVDELPEDLQEELGEPDDDEAHQ